MKKKVKTFVIDRDRWLRGEGLSFSSLVSPDGTLCVLGFVGESVGVPIEAMNEDEAYLPNDLDDKYYRLFHLITSQSVDWKAFTEINDSIFISDKVREQKLQALAETYGFKFKFVSGTEKKRATKKPKSISKKQPKKKLTPRKNKKVKQVVVCETKQPTALQKILNNLDNIPLEDQVHTERESI
jgi:hypothetical protein